MLYDKNIREPLFAFLEGCYGKVRILEEMSMGSSRADAVMVTAEGLFGIEIKSDADSYARLSRQVADYNLYFDFNYCVVGTSHAGHIEEHLPDWWGIITVEETGEGADFYILRKPGTNPALDPAKKISLLWRPELARLQEKNGMPAYKGYSKAFVAGKVLERVPPELLWPQAMEELFERDYTTIAAEINRFRVEEQGRKPRRKGYRRKRRRKSNKT